jgi:hypothetical protein
MAKKILMAIIAIVILMSMFTGCSREGNSTNTTTKLGAKTTCADTVSATLTNSDYTSGVTVNWSKRVGKSAVTLTGLQTLAFVLDGDEVMEGIFSDKSLSSIELKITGQSSGKSVKISTSLTGKISNLSVDNNYFKLEGNTLQFYPHYFEVGEDVVINAVFTYKGDGVVNQVMDSEKADGFFTFTVGENTGETFSGILDGVGDFIDDVFDGNSENNSNGEGNNNADTKPSLSINCKIDGKDSKVHLYQEDAEANPIIVSATDVAMTFFTRENSAYNITKVYIVPVGYEDKLQKLAWNNEWYSDNCHKFFANFSQFAGQTISVRVEFLDGAEWNPLPDHYYGYITLKIPQQ